MVPIECLVCDEPIKIPEYYNTEDYDGEVVCQECTSRLHLKLGKSKVRKYRVIEKKFKRPSEKEINHIIKTLLEKESFSEDKGDK